MEVDEITGLGANCPLLKLEVLDGAANKVEGDKPDDNGSNFPLLFPSFCELSDSKSSDEAPVRPKSGLDKLLELSGLNPERGDDDENRSVGTLSPLGSFDLSDPNDGGTTSGDRGSELGRKLVLLTLIRAASVASISFLLFKIPRVAFVSKEAAGLFRTSSVDRGFFSAPDTPILSLPSAN